MLEQPNGPAVSVEQLLMTVGSQAMQIAWWTDECRKRDAQIVELQAKLKELETQLLVDAHDSYTAEQSESVIDSLAREESAGLPKFRTPGTSLAEDAKKR